MARAATRGRKPKAKRGKRAPRKTAPTVAAAPEFTDKQRSFCAEYLIDLNATQAAIRAGYSADSAALIGYENLRKPHIADEIARLFGERQRRAEVKADRILSEIDALSLAKSTDIWDLDADVLRLKPMREWPERAKRAISAIKVRVYPEEFPPLEKADFDKLEAIATGKAYAFDISRAILPEDQAFMQRLVRQLREINLNRYQVLEVKLWDKNAALEKSGKNRGLFADHVQLRDVLALMEAVASVVLRHVSDPVERDRVHAGLAELMIGSPNGNGGTRPRLLAS